MEENRSTQGDKTFQGRANKLHICITNYKRKRDSSVFYNKVIDGTAIKRLISRLIGIGTYPDARREPVGLHAQAHT